MEEKINTTVSFSDAAMSVKNVKKRNNERYIALSMMNKVAKERKKKRKFSILKFSLTMHSRDCVNAHLFFHTRIFLLRKP